MEKTDNIPIHLFHKGKKSIYYTSSISPVDKQCLEDKSFVECLRALQLLSGFSLFSDFVKNEIFPHLLNEADRLMNGDIVLNHIKTGRYAGIVGVIKTNVK